MANTEIAQIFTDIAARLKIAAPFVILGLDLRIQTVQVLWIPAFAGMTVLDRMRTHEKHRNRQSLFRYCRPH